MAMKRYLLALDHEGEIRRASFSLAWECQHLHCAIELAELARRRAGRQSRPHRVHHHMLLQADGASPLLRGLSHHHWLA